MCVYTPTNKQIHNRFVSCGVKLHWTSWKLPFFPSFQLFHIGCGESKWACQNNVGRNSCLSISVDLQNVQRSPACQYRGRLLGEKSGHDFQQGEKQQHICLLPARLSGATANLHFCSQAKHNIRAICTSKSLGIRAHLCFITPSPRIAWPTSGGAVRYLNLIRNQNVADRLVFCNNICSFLRMCRVLNNY